MATWHKFSGSAIVALGLLFSVVGCGLDTSKPKPAPEATAQQKQPLLVDSGPADDSSHPEVGWVVSGGSIAGVKASMGILVAPDLAVALIIGVVKDVFKPPNSVGASCGTISGVFDPSEVTFALGHEGSNFPDFVNGKTDGFVTRGVKRIITNGKSTTCDSSYAFLVLDQPINDVPIPPLQYDHLPALNDNATMCGWGPMDTVCDYPTTLQCATGKVLIAGGGYYATTQQTFASSDWIVDVHPCGEAGSPLYDSSGAVFALLGLEVQNVDNPSPLNQACLNCLYTEADGASFVSQWDLVTSAFAAVGKSPWRAGHPKPVDLGNTCTDDLDCNSQMCVNAGGQGYCSQDCTSSACPDSLVCTSAGNSNVCLPGVTPHPAGCSTSASEGEGKKNSNLVLLGLGLGAVFLMRHRRRRRNPREPQ